MRCPICGRMLSDKVEFCTLCNKEFSNISVTGEYKGIFNDLNLNSIKRIISRLIFPLALTILATYVLNRINMIILINNMLSWEQQLTAYNTAMMAGVATVPESVIITSALGVIVVAAWYHFGEDKSKYRKYVIIATVGATAVGVLMWLYGLLLSTQAEEIVRPLTGYGGKFDEISDMAVIHLRYYYAGILGITIMTVGKALLVANGNGWNWFWLSVAYCVLRILGNYLFLGVLQMNFVGASIASLFAAYASALLAFVWVCFGKKDYGFKINKLRVK